MSITTSEINVTTARANWSATLRKLRTTHIVRLMSHHQPVAVLLSPERYEELLQAIEDAEDRQALAEHRADPEPDLIAWEQAREDLGL